MASNEISIDGKMVGVCKRYAQLNELVKAIVAMQKNYVYVRVDYPCRIKDYFVVKGWEKKSKTE